MTNERDQFKLPENSEELPAQAGGVPKGSKEDPFPAELMADNISSKHNLRSAIWRRLSQSKELISHIRENNLHLAGRVNSGSGRALLFGGAAVIGTGGLVFLCRQLYKRHHNEEEHKKLHQVLRKKK